MQKVNRSFDAIKIGDTANEQIEITGDLLDRYIDISNDYSSIHDCHELAQNAGFAGRVVHGTLISGFFSALIGTKLPGHNALLLEIQCKFHSPAIVGDVISVEVSVQGKHESVECVSLKLTAFRADGKKLSTGKALVKVRRL